MKNREPFDGHSVDIWAVGVILFLMLTGFPPWERACRTDGEFAFFLHFALNFRFANCHTLAFLALTHCPTSQINYNVLTERFKFMSAGYLVQMLTEWELGLSPDAMDLLQRMVWIDPRDRLSLRQVRNHPWMLVK